MKEGRESRKRGEMRYIYIERVGKRERGEI